MDRATWWLQQGLLSCRLERAAWRDHGEAGFLLERPGASWAIPSSSGSEYRLEIDPQPQSGFASGFAFQRSHLETACFMRFVRVDRCHFPAPYGGLLDVSHWVFGFHGLAEPAEPIKERVHWVCDIVSSGLDSSLSVGRKHPVSGASIAVLGCLLHVTVFHDQPLTRVETLARGFFLGSFWFRPQP